MTFLQGLYKVFIGPLELLLETVFSIAYRNTNSFGLSIICLSLVMNFLLLPLYNRADKIQEEENAIQKKLKKWSDHINKTFKGDERYMMQQTYYRQNNYKPIYAIRGLMPLVLEIPFFVAAYNYLSNLLVLNGSSFSRIYDLGGPDQILTIFGVSINLLPILMTVINIISSLIYTKDAPLKTKIQLYAMALLFLVILYNSPAGLVLYWTLNNVFSLVKNIILKFDKKRNGLRIASSIIGVCLIVLTFIKLGSSILQKIIFIIVGILLNIPLLLKIFNKNNKKININVDLKKHDKIAFFISILALIMFIGLYIPSTFLSASPEELIEPWSLVSPNTYIVDSLLLSVGTFGVWCSVFYFLSDEKIKKVISVFMTFFLVIALLDFFLFGTNLGKLSTALVYDDGLIFSSKEKLINLLMIFVVFVVLVYFSYKKNFNIKLITIGLCVVFLIMSIINIKNIDEKASRAINIINEQRENVQDDVIRLSKNENNVVVIMLDRAISSYLPYLFEEHPKLQTQFAGFTYYPNTTSYGAFTNVGTPGLFGGYDYTPKNMNKKDDESLCDKQNEALKVMPKLFYEQNYDVTICDPPYAGYEWVPDLNVFDEFEEARTFITTRMVELDNTKDLVNVNESLRRNVFYFSLMKTMPVFLQKTLYGFGFYNDLDAENGLKIDWQVVDGISKASGVDASGITNYAVLEKINKFTKAIDSNKGSFLMLDNDTTHHPVILREPDYEMLASVDNSEYDKEHEIRYSIDGKEMVIVDPYQMSHYHSLGYALTKLGNWLDYLRQEGVYDNTRIIICSDHGKGLYQFEDMIFSDEYFGDAMWYNALLMVKDFNETEFKINNDFMTLCDVAYLATKDLGFDSINPYTNSPLKNDDEKKNVEILQTEWDIEVNNGNTYMDGEWYSVHDDIFNKDNWQKIEDPSK